MQDNKFDNRMTCFEASEKPLIELQVFSFSKQDFWNKTNMFFIFMVCSGLGPALQAVMCESVFVLFYHEQRW